MKKKAIWPLRVVFCAVVLTIAIAIKGSSLGAAGENSQVYIGAWVGEKVNLPGDLDAFEWVVGKKMAIVHRYSGNPPYLNGEHFNVAWAEQVRARGSIPMLSWDPRLDDGDDNLLQAALGSRDDYIRLWARELKDWGRPIFFRMMWEQNCAWFPWTATVEPRLSQFKALWQRIVGIFREEGANNVTFVWSPHVSGFGSDPIMATYPGDAFVDWVALDGYPYKSGRGDFFETFKPDYDILVSQLSKPIMIAETSLDRSSDLEKSGIIADILTNQLPNNFPKVKALVWFDEIDCDGVNYSIMTDWGPLSQQAFRRGLESSYYASNNFSNLYTSPIPIAEVILHPPATATPTVTPLRSPTPTHNQGYDLAGNLVTNGDFESVGSGGLPSAWITTAHAECLSLDDSKAMAGSLSLKHYSNSGPSYVVYQEVPAYAGQGYSFIGWVNISNVTAYPRFSVQLLPMNSNNGVIKTITIATYTSVTDGWQEMRAENLVMPSGTVKARLAMKVDNLKGTINVDSFSLYSSNAPLATATETGPTATSTASLTPQPTPTEAATPTKSPTPDPLDERNLLVNPSFAETITGSDDPVGWSMSAWINPAYVSVDRFAGFDGDGLGLIIAGENSSYSVYQDVPIRGGGQYIFTGWVRVPFRPAGAFKVEISPMNQSGGLVGVPVNKGYYDSTTNWEQFTLKIIMPDSATVARVQLKAEGFRHAAHVDKLIFYCSDQTPTFTPTSSSTSTSTSTATATPMAMPTETMPAILTPTMVPTPWGNLLVNPSFRGGVNEGWNVPGWISSLVWIDPAAAVDGDGRGLVMSANGNSYMVTQDVSAVPGERYELIGHVCVPEMRSGSFRLELMALNSNGGAVGSTATRAYSAQSGTWETFKLEMVAPSNAAKVRVRLKSDNMKGKVYADGMGLMPGNLPPTPTATPSPFSTPTATNTATPAATDTPVPTSTATVTPTRLAISDNLITNGSFTRTVVGGDEPENWYTAPWGVPYLSVSPLAAYDGDGFGLLQTSEGASYYLNQSVKVVPGTRYLLKGWVNVVERRAGGYKVEVFAQTAFGGSAGYLPAIPGYFAPTSGWRSFEQEFLAPPSATKFLIQLRVDGFRGTVYTDALSLQVVQ